MSTEDDSRVTVDLHVHTTASDGTIQVSRRIELANETELETIAITDHDILSDWFSQPVTEQDGINVITGVEVRADLFDTKIEIIGYYLDPTDEDLLALLERTREFRRQRNQKIIDKIKTTTDVSLSYDALKTSVEGNLGRPHIAERLVESGIVDSVGEAFEEYLAEGGKAYVPMERIPAGEVISTIHDAGGVTSLAHPGRIRTDLQTAERMIQRLSELGIDGIETWYPYSQNRSSEYVPIETEKSLEFASQYELIPTGGSDCHGPGSGKFRMGEVGPPVDTLTKLRKRANRRREAEI